jgi:hypothetical protein
MLALAAGTSTRTPLAIRGETPATEMFAAGTEIVLPALIAGA